MTIRDAIDQLDVLCVLDAPSLRTAVAALFQSKQDVEEMERDGNG